MLRYWLKILNGLRDRLRYITFSYLRENIHKELPGQCRNWSLVVRKLLIDIGREYVWDNNTPVNGNLISYAEQTLVDLYIAEWSATMRNSTKCVNYILYKTLFAHEPYLVSVKSYKHRRVVSCLRLSAHKLDIKVGRYIPVRPRHMRYCRICDTRDIEDEYHFILVCPKYK